MDNSIMSSQNFDYFIVCRCCLIWAIPDWNREGEKIASVFHNAIILFNKLVKRMSDRRIRKSNSNKNPYTSENIENWYQIQQMNIRVGLMVLDLVMFIIMCPVSNTYRDGEMSAMCVSWHNWKQVFYCWEWPVNKLIVFGIRCNQFELSKGKSRSSDHTNIIYLRHSQLIHNWNSLFSFTSHSFSFRYK